MLRGPNISPKSTKAACDEVECAEFELKSLHAGQQKAIEQAIFLGMTTDEEREFEKRGLRIRDIIDFLGRNHH